ncbi:MAG: sulfurtransferase TusA family protein [Dehalococcoidia bacterium]|nr:sulfurtransferase TusA family protein [Dehalococcoidia bacterium]
MFEVDVIGLACPIPVVRTQKAMNNHPGEVILVKVDSNVAKEHITSMAEGKGYGVKVTELKGEIQMELTPKT